MPFPSSQAKINIPEDVPLWPWLFDSEESVHRHAQDVGGFRQAETGEYFTYKKIKELSSFLATALSCTYQLKAGDTIVILCGNSIWYPVVMFAGLKLGLVISGASPTYTLDEVTYAFQKVKPKIVFVDDDSSSTALEGLQKVGLSKESAVFMTGHSKNSQDVRQLINLGRNRGTSQQPAWAFEVGQTARNTCAFLCFSSGTTGLPKAVMISHHNIIAQCLQMRALRKPGPAGILLSPLPLFHITGLAQIMHLPVLINQDVVLVHKFNMKKMLDAIVKYRANELWLVPPILIRMVNDPLVEKYELTHITQFNTGAAPLSPEVIQKLAHKYPLAGIKQGWGMTESTSCITSTPPEYLDPQFAHTVGAAVANTILKVVDVESRVEVGFDIPGEILAKGPQVSLGYLDNEIETLETYDKEGFLHTGDLGSIGANGLVTIHDRIKELIKVRGTGVAPAELEDLLLGHAVVKDVAVIGVPDTYSGELPKAFVVLDKNIQGNYSTVEMLQSYVKGKTTRAKWIDGGIEFLDEIPKSASGKILRRVLKEGEKRKLNTEKTKIVSKL